MESRILKVVCSDYKEKFGEELIIHGRQTVGGGCISSSTKLDTNLGTLFLKWNQQVEADLFLREAESLNEMASVENEYLQIPQALLAKKVDETPGYILMDFLPTGNVANQDENLGIGLAVLHRKTADNFGFYHDNYCGATRQPNDWMKSWIDFFGQKRILYLVKEIRRARHLSTSEVDTYKRLVERLPELIGTEHQPALIHGDLWSGNYMYTGSGPSLIDPASYYADREMEFSIMTMFGGFSQTTWRAYQQTFPFEKGWEERVLLYQIYHVLNHYYLFGGSYGSQAYSIAKKFI